MSHLSTPSYLKNYIKFFFKIPCMYSEHLDPVPSSHSPDNSPTRSSYLTPPNSTHSFIINSLSPVSAADLCTVRGTPTGHRQPTSGTLSNQSDSSSSMLSMSSRPVLHTVPTLLASVKNCFCVWRWYVCVSLCYASAGAHCCHRKAQIPWSWRY